MQLQAVRTVLLHCCKRATAALLHFLDLREEIGNSTNNVSHLLIGQIVIWIIYSRSCICLSKQRCQETVSQGKTSSGRGCQTDRSTLKPSSLTSVKVNDWKIAVGQGVKVPSPDIFGCTMLCSICIVRENTSDPRCIC